MPYTMGPWPTYFGNPFRSAAGAALTNAVVTAAVSAAMPTMGMPTGLLPRADVDVTLLRPFHPETEGVAGALFDFPTTQVRHGEPKHHGHVQRRHANPYFRLQNLSRMSNLLTTRSNVYAVWITVGYFQVTPWYGYGIRPRRRSMLRRGPSRWLSTRPGTGQRFGPDQAASRRSTCSIARSRSVSNVASTTTSKTRSCSAGSSSKSPIRTRGGFPFSRRFQAVRGLSQICESSEQIGTVPLSRQVLNQFQAHRIDLSPPCPSPARGRHIANCLRGIAGSPHHLAGGN